MIKNAIFIFIVELCLFVPITVNIKCQYCLSYEKELAKYGDGLFDCGRTCDGDYCVKWSGRRLLSATKGYEESKAWARFCHTPTTGTTLPGKCQYRTNWLKTEALIPGELGTVFENTNGRICVCNTTECNTAHRPTTTTTLLVGTLTVTAVTARLL